MTLLIYKEYGSWFIIDMSWTHYNNSKLSMLYRMFKYILQPNLQKPWQAASIVINRTIHSLYKKISLL